MDTDKKLNLCAKGGCCPHALFFQDGLELTDEDQRILLSREHEDNLLFELVRKGRLSDRVLAEIRKMYP